MAGLLNRPHGRSGWTRCRIPPSVGGRSDWLRLPRRTLSFPIPIRFIPAHSDPVLTFNCIFSHRVAVARLRYDAEIAHDASSCHVRSTRLEGNRSRAGEERRDGLIPE